MSTPSRAFVRSTIVNTLTAAVIVGSASGALAATSSHTSPATPTQSSFASTTGGSASKQGGGQLAQEFTLSNGAVAHVYKLPKGGYMAWITIKGQRIASLSAHNPTATAKGYKYEINQANGFVGVIHPGGWHSEQDKPKPSDLPGKHRRDAAGITAKTSVLSVRAWQAFRVTGKTAGLKAGSKVTLQQKQHGKWVSLPASASVARDGSYSLGVKLGLKGKNDLRLVSGTTASPVFHITVR
ncbi:hypothetical protein [Streptomyces sp. CAS3]